MSTAELAAPRQAILAQPSASAIGYSRSSTPANAITALCPDCRNVRPNLVHDFGSGELMCADCNSVVGKRLIDSRSTQPRAGSMSPSDRDAGDLARNTAGTHAMLARAMRSRTQSRLAAQKCERHERNLAKAYSEIDSACVTMDLPRGVAQTASGLFKRVELENLHRGKSIDAVIATCIFLACRQQSVPRTFKEICSLTRVPRKGIGRTFKHLKEKLGTEAGPMSSDDLMARFCANLSLLSTAQECAIRLNQMAKQRDTLAGKSPVSAAGACIYMASHLVGQPRDTKVISQVAGVSEVTLKNSYKLLFADRFHLITEQVLGEDPMASMEALPFP
ncbi:transcription initiation factor IIB [Coemansia biformis]|uniref:Transcription initiation factor IIB n=1 Tax=Coemansia biformis TaxID=1286918 RepID=A0A9W8CNM0_9FUNG|nr:transcription initiation factor IIB [Coemansia biformis]